MTGRPSDPLADAWTVPLPDWAAGAALAVSLGAWLLLSAVVARPAASLSAPAVSAAHSPSVRP